MTTSQPATRTLTIHLGGQSRPFTLFDTRLGLEICEQVLGGKAYPLPPLTGQVRTIVDIGANVGASTLYFAMKFPAARVLAFEPSRESYSLLKTNTAGLPLVQCFPYGLFDGDRQATLYRGVEDGVTNSIGVSSETTGEGDIVELRDARAALAENLVNTIDILKIDTEGCELPILCSLMKFLARVGILYIEFHSEHDRVTIDQRLLPTHHLYHAEINHPCRGELCYVSRQWLPTDVEQTWGIRLP